ncbi:MAG: hypothetical protein O3C63_03985 [Cyanobacteria bacterium]|nr:hypothetical protein [Cyanobacteriota bacterium]MDA1020994.1 hypothetical protein [Cyanobacteriota bacterium]
MLLEEKQFSLNPAQATMLSFTALCIVGCFFLMLPIANSSGEWRDWVSALFMSVSSVCVTGLSVVQLGTDFTIWGQLIVLILIQIGGLSYMTLTTVLVYMTGKRLSYSDSKVFDMSNNSESKINFADFVIKIGLLTFTIELLGVLALLPNSLEVTGFDSRNINDLPGLFAGIFDAVFHSVSAFCNAGLSLYANSLEGFRDNPWILFVFSFLPILGGLGYTVLNELYNWYQEYAKDKSTSFRPSLHTRVCLWMTGILLVLGVLIQLYLVFAQNPDHIIIINNGESIISQYQAQSGGDAFWVSFFQSCAARSSGFNSIPLRELGDPSLLFLIIWMFIGACPGGTAGGIKVTTLALVGAIMWSGLKGGETKIFNRSINQIYQKRALIVFISTVVMILFFSWLINIFESGGTMRFIDQLFEVVSGFTTVGLSTGITTELSSPSLLVLCLCMLIGRPGPLLFLMAMITEDIYTKPKYPEEGILIG